MVELERGDEYIGLPSGFLYAGAPTVISSLWAVDDLATSLLMNHWYENILQKKMGKAAALREAQLWVRDLTNTEVMEHLEREHFKQHVPCEIIRSYKLRWPINQMANPLSILTIRVRLRAMGVGNNF
jgi:CHAT domain-containing protein